MKVKGKVFRYQNNVDTDVIIPARYLNTSDPKELAAHCMEDIDPDFVKNVKPGDIIVADRNFGCGASTFARIFYRNAINIGLPILECEQAVKGIEAGDEVEVDFDAGIIRNLTKGTAFKARPFPEFMKKIMAADGLVNYIRDKYKDN